MHQRCFSFYHQFDGIIVLVKMISQIASKYYFSLVGGQQRHVNGMMVIAAGFVVLKIACSKCFEKRIFTEMFQQLLSRLVLAAQLTSI